MAYSSLRACVEDLEKHGRLVRVSTPLDPNLEIAEVHRRIFDAGGPAILFENVKGSPFQAVSNIYGNSEQTAFVFRHTLEKAKRLIEIKADPTRALRNPLRYWDVPMTALAALPRKKRKTKVQYGKTTIDQLPQVVSWPMDGGAFVTLPQVFTMPPASKNIMESNIGMYRIQLSGNDYVQNKEIGLHYQIHRGIGVHHRQYQASPEDFNCSIFVGGPPSHAFSAIMPLPEGLSELTFAGLLGGRRFRYAIDAQGHYLSGDADFVITGKIRKDIKKPEGPFGDHLGYYSLTHDFPVMEVDSVYYHKDAIWHFTVVGRPPQEDSAFGWLIHELVEELTTQEFPGVKEIHAVDVAGVHPLLLAVGSERYMPFREIDYPEEILTQANRILGSGQTSLAKYLIITAPYQQENIVAHDIEDFFTYVLERIDWRRDLHFHTNTSIDTLDYSGDGWNAGSKVIMAAYGKPIRTLATRLTGDFKLPTGFTNAKLAGKGILAIETATYDVARVEEEKELLSAFFQSQNMDDIPLIVICDDSEFLAANYDNFLWATFTRSNPAIDIWGVDEQINHKHWGCNGSLIIDARVKPHHAPPLIPDKKVKEKIDKLFAKNGELAQFG